MVAGTRTSAQHVLMKRNIATRDAAIALLREITGTTLTPVDQAAFRDAEPADVVTFARNHQVLAAYEAALNNKGVCEFLGSGVVDILAEAQANKVRNAVILKQIAELDDAFANEGIRKAVILKGGAFLVSDRESCLPWRYLTDIDLLIDERELKPALNAMRNLKYSADGASYDKYVDPHYPALFRTVNEAPVELHTRLGPEKCETLLNSKTVFDRANWPVQGFRTLAIPLLEDRFSHLIAHAQIYSHRYRRKQFVLRDALDFHNLVARHDIDVAGIRDIYVSSGYRHEFDGFIKFSRFVLGDLEALDSSHWGRETLRSQAYPMLAKIHLLRHWIEVAMNVVVTPSKWAAGLKTFSSPQRRNRRLATWRRQLFD